MQGAGRNCNPDGFRSRLWVGDLEGCWLAIETQYEKP